MRAKRIIKRFIGSKVAVICTFGFILVALLVAADEIWDIPANVFNASPTPINWTEIGVEVFFIFLAGALVISILSKLESAQRQGEEALRKVNRALKTLSECNQILIRAADETDLLRKTCQAIVKIGGYRLAWVGFADQYKKETVHLVAQAGDDERFISPVVIAGSDTEQDCSPAVTSLRTGKSCVVENILTAPKYARWRGEAAKYGCKSLVALPLRTNRQTFGVLNIYSAESATFNPNEVGLLTELAIDLAYSIMTLRTRAERKQAEQALREAEEKYKKLVEATSDMIWESDEKGVFTFVSPRIKDILGYKVGEVVGKKRTLDLAPEEEKRKWLGRFKEVNANREPFSGFEITYIHKNGSSVVLETSGAPFFDSAGNFKGFAGVNKDITGRKQAEQALREAEEKYKKLVEATSDMIWESDEKGVFTFVSPRIKDILGYKVGEVVGKKRTLDLAPEEEKRKWLGRFKEVNANREPFSGFEITHLHKNGNLILLETSGIPFFDSAGNFKGFAGINKDITERKRIQEQLVIADRLASVGELASGIAHELNNPLTGVIGFAQIALDKDIPDYVREDVQIVYSEAQRAAQVVKNLLTFARKHPLAKQLMSINSIIEKVLELRAYEQKVNNIQVNTHFAPELPEVMADYFQLQQVFLNIVINAEYFMIEAHNGGNLTITTEMAEDTIRASFADDGPGIAEENLGHLFDPFFTTKEVGSGTGLGLSICHGIVAEHGGRIYAESEPGKGATFIVELPIGAGDRKGG
jgi:PAS domain S-box-containing protein